MRLTVAMGTMDFFDPHFHIWDVNDGTSTGHDPAILFAPGGDPLYTPEKYEAEFASLPPRLRHTGGVFLEAVSVCHVDLKGTDPAFRKACEAEAVWASGQLAAAGKEYAVVATCALEDPGVGVVLDAYAKLPGFRGIRQIVNKDPDWPRNGGALGDPLEIPQWVKGLGELASRGLSFDLQLNPGQLAHFAEIYAGVPDMTVVINHLGCPTLADLTDRADVFFGGLERLAKFPNCYIKLSMLCYADKDWDKNETVTGAVRRVIDIFGTERCFFASNYPVDVKDGWPAERLFPAFLKLVEHLDADAQARLFAGNACKAYRL